MKKPAAAPCIEAPAYDKLNNKDREKHERKREQPNRGREGRLALQPMKGVPGEAFAAGSNSAAKAVADAGSP